MVFGDPLPLSFYAKSVGFYAGYAGASRWNPVQYLFVFVGIVAPYLAITIFFYKKDSLKLTIAFILPVLVTFTYYFFVVQIMGYAARYYFPAVPFFVVSSFLIADSYKRVEKANNAALARGKYVRLGLVLLVVFLVSRPDVQVQASKVYDRAVISKDTATAGVTKPPASSAKVPRRLPSWEAISSVAEIVRRLPVGAVVSMSEYGYIGAQCPDVHILDPLGLNDPVFAHKGFSCSNFLARKPDLIWLPHSDYTGITAQLVNSDEFTSRYDFYPGAFNYGLAVRRESVYYDTITALCGKALREQYGGFFQDDKSANQFID